MNFLFFQKPENINIKPSEILIQIHEFCNLVVRFYFFHYIISTTMFLIFKGEVQLKVY